MLPELCLNGKMERPMECQFLSPAELPHTTLLYSSYLSNFSSVSEYYVHPPDLEGISRAAKEIRQDDAARNGVVEVLRRQNIEFGGGAETSRNLDRLRDGAFAVVTGQQVGLLGGPAFSVYKALAAIRLANDLTAAGTNAVPVFWLATEDHDLAEVDHCFFGARGGLERFDLTTSGLEGRRVGEIALGDAVSEISSRATGILEGASSEEVARWIAESYRPEETFGSAFAKLMTRMFAGRGLIFLDPLSPELHRLSAPTMLHALKDHEVLTKELIERAADLERAGFHAQVKVVESSTLVFRIVDGQRVAIRSKNGGFVAGTIHESLEDTLKAAQSNPEQFSANALLRPVIQDTLLPTVAYIGGPAEIAYHAQTSLIYKRLLGRAPAILPRAGFTLVTGHVANLLKKYNLDVRDAFADKQNLRGKMEAEVLPQALTERFEAGEKTLQTLLADLREPLARLDQTLAGALDTAAEKMLYQYNGLRSKAGRAEGFRTGVLDTHEKEITRLLLPNNALQERSLSVLPFLASQGRELLDRLEREIKPGSGEHCIFYL
jgi:bacillithiol biosynthesis cysteine-adding enzyme BshC